MDTDRHGAVILGIESSCDETGVALVCARADGTPELLAQTLHSQVDLHAAYGGVVPELASRDHIRRMLPLARQAVAEAGLTLADVDQVAYTRGPGLAGALLVGAGLATALAAALGVPAVGVHHLEGHLLSPFLSADPPRFPFVALLVSGGHTQLFDVTGVGVYRLLGESIDDAAGEAFDKSAKLLGLGYPGGPELARLAAFGDPSAFDLPRPLLHRDTLDFSFAGLKTAVRTQVERLGTNVCEQQRADLAAATQEAIAEILVRKSVRALERAGRDRLVVAGGVSANRRLREMLDAAAAGAAGSSGASGASGATGASGASGPTFRVHYAEPALCTDNGAMIALAAALRWQVSARKADAPTAESEAGPRGFDVKPRWPLVELSAP